MEEVTTPETPVVETPGETEAGTVETPETPESETPKGEAGEKPASEPEEPPVRKTPIDYILERKMRKLEKLKAEKLKAVESELAEHGEEEEESIDPEDEDKIDKVIQKKYGSQLSEMSAQKVKVEVQEFLNNSKEGKYFKEFEETIVKYATHPSRAHLPIASIAYEVAGSKLLQIGAKMAKEADIEASRTKAGGTPARTTGVKDYSSLSDEEMEAEILKVKGG